MHITCIQQSSMLSQSAQALNDMHTYPSGGEVSVTCDVERFETNIYVTSGVSKGVLRVLKHPRGSGVASQTPNLCIQLMSQIIAWKKQNTMLAT